MYFSILAESIKSKAEDAKSNITDDNNTSAADTTPLPVDDDKSKGIGDQSSSHQGKTQF